MTSGRKKSGKKIRVGRKRERIMEWVRAKKNSPPKL